MICGCVEVNTDSLLTKNVWDTFMRNCWKKCMLVNIFTVCAALVNDTDARRTSRNCRHGKRVCASVGEKNSNMDSKRVRSHFQGDLRNEKIGAAFSSTGVFMKL